MLELLQATRQNANALRHPPPTSADVKLATFNVEGSRSNRHYLQQIADSVDVLAIQEHWLHNYEIEQTYQEMPNHQWHAKAHDDDNPVPPSCRPRGKAGIAIIWKNKLNQHIQVLPEGGNRLAAIYLETTPPIVLINTYLPCDDGRIDDYSALLDEVREVTIKYQDTANIIWVGDMNGSLERAAGSGLQERQSPARLLQGDSLHSSHPGERPANLLPP